jgi:hypothetical protein
VRRSIARRADWKFTPVEYSSQTFRLNEEQLKNATERAAHRCGDPLHVAQTGDLIRFFVASNFYLFLSYKTFLNYKHA